MEDHWLWYLTGAFDTAGKIKVNIRKDTDLSIGYSLRPELAFARRDDMEAVFGMLDEYCDHHGVYYRIEESNNSDTLRLIVDDPNSVRRFLEPIVSGLMQQREAAELMLEEVLPAVEQGTHREQEGFYGLMDTVERLREIGHRRDSSKYTKEYFMKEWKMR